MRCIIVNNVERDFWNFLRGDVYFLLSKKFFVRWTFGIFLLIIFVIILDMSISFVFKKFFILLFDFSELTTIFYDLVCLA